MQGLKGWYQCAVLLMRAVVMRAVGASKGNVGEIRLEVGVVDSVRWSSGPADVGESLFGCFEKPAHVGSPDSCCLVLSSANWVIVLSRTNGGWSCRGS